MQADKKQIVRLIKTARGQLEGILKMIDEDQYCVDIATQLMAADAIVRKASREVLQAHIKGCVREALENNQGQGEQKIDEMVQLIDKMYK